MTESQLFYVNAMGPVTLNVGGKTLRLNPGESRGPFTKAEVAQISSSGNSQRLSITPAKGCNKSSITEDKALDKDIDPLYTGQIPSASTPELPPDPFKTSSVETLEINPMGRASITVKETTVDKVIPEQEKEIPSTSKSEPIPQPPSPEEQTTEKKIPAKSPSTTKKTTRRRSTKKTTTTNSKTVEPSVDNKKVEE